MAKLTLDIEYEYDFFLIGVSCHEKEYRLSWALNNNLNIDLIKIEDLKIDSKKQKDPLTYSMLKHDNELNYRQYYLIANRGSLGLLIPEQKQADFFLLIKGVISLDEKVAIIKKTKETPLVLTAFEINPNLLKSKENLLF